MRCLHPAQAGLSVGSKDLEAKNTRHAISTGRRAAVVLGRAQLLGGQFWASPIYADGRLYFANDEGDTFVLEPGRACKVLATNKLDDGCMASPAAVGKSLFLRTKTHLYCLEQQ